MPFLSDKGTSFDITDGPDLFIEVVSPERAVLYKSGIAKNLTPTTLPQAFVTNANVSNYVNVDKLLAIYLWDSDSAINDFITSSHFRIEQTYKLPYPKEIKSKLGGTDVTIYLSWSR